MPTQLDYPNLSSRENERSLLRENPLDSQNNKMGNASLGPHTVTSIIANAEHGKNELSVTTNR
jgi:hypothetical protein